MTTAEVLSSAIMHNSDHVGRGRIPWKAFAEQYAESVGVSVEYVKAMISIYSWPAGRMQDQRNSINKGRFYQAQSDQHVPMCIDQGFIDIVNGLEVPEASAREKMISFHQAHWQRTSI